MVNAAPTRQYVINNSGANPKATPVLVAGGGITPRVGAALRAGVRARALCALPRKPPRKPPDDRSVSIWNVEGEWSFGYTKLSGEVTRDRLQTITGAETAYGWFVQGQQTLTPRFFVAARQEGASAPPLRTADGRRPPTADARDRGDRRVPAQHRFHPSRQLPEPQALHEAAWDQQVGVSVVWARRWW